MYLQSRVLQRAVFCVVITNLPGLTHASDPRSDLAAALQTPGALQSRVRFDRVTTADGLSNDSVFSILQDRNGFLWLGTQAGLNRYDGYSVKQYRHDPRNPNSLGGDFVGTLLEDSRGAIWTGNPGRFDPLNDTFIRYALPRALSVQSRPSGLQKIVEDRAGFIWLGFSGGRSLYQLDPATGKLSAFDIGGGLPAEVDIAIKSMYRDTAGILWLGASTGLVRFDPSTGASRHYPQVRPNRLPSAITGIDQDAAGNLWLATTGDTGNFFDPVRGAFARHWLPPAKRHDSPANAVHAAKDGVVWQGTMDGLEIFDPTTGGFAVLRHHAGDQRSLGGNEILSIAEDGDGNLWFGAKGGGVSRFSPATLRFGAWRRNPADPRSLSDENVRAIYRDRSGVLWIGTYDAGLNRYDPASGTFTHFRHDRRTPASLNNDRVYSIYEDRSGNLWIGTGTGINRLNRGSGTFTRFKRGPLDGDGAISPTYSLFEDRHGALWFGTAGGRAALDRRTGDVTSVNHVAGISMYEDRHGNLWFGGPGSLTRRDSSGNLRTIVSPPGGQINFIHEGEDGLLWLAAETGLFRFDPKTETYTIYTTQDGLPDNVVQCILGDRTGNLWLSTNNGISRFNPRDNSFVNYHESDGLQGEQFNRKSCSVDASGILYFGGLRGFNVFDPSRIPAKPHDAGRIVMTELRIRGKNVSVRPGSVLPRPIWELDSLHLSHEDEEFSIEFAALGYKDQARTRYRFKLDPLESQWTEVDSRNRSARYTGLRPGDYRLRAQASVDGRTWSSPETSIALSIAPPWWMTPWSRGGATLLLAALLIGGYKWRVRTLKERGLRLEKLVDQRTAELVEARDQAEQANRAKSVFLANMSHELRTPLNAILGFSNLLRGKSASEEQRRDLDIINRSGEHLLTLINDVLDLARIEAGRDSLEITTCDLNAVVRDVTDMMSVRAAEKHLALHVVESGEFPGFVYTDAARLREVLINLLGNAVKYTEKGSITLRIGSRNAGTEDHCLLWLEVEDTGIGIAASDQERIFQPFEQAAEVGRQRGTGLGLAITRRVVELMDGSIELSSAPGGGSCFRVEIPVKPAEEFEAKPVGYEQVFGLEPGQSDYRVLIVEDEPENWMVLQRLLENAGFQVRVAENGKTAVEGFREWRPQFIWMDLRMPLMDGIETTKRIRALDGGEEVRIAAVTASGLESHRSEVLAAGVDDYVRKPYRPQEIFDCMRRLLGVRYRHADTVPEREDRMQALNAEAVGQLPAPLRMKLRSALVTLDASQISEVVREVGEQDAALGFAMARYAEKFAYSPILKAVHAVKEESVASND